MSALAAAPQAPTLFDEGAGHETLDDLIVGAWAGIEAGRVVACPVCDGELVPRHGAHSRPVAGRCTSCGSVLT